MPRFDPTSNHGYVRFPTDNPEFYDSREGGIACYAIWWRNKELVCMADLVIGLRGHVVSSGYVKQNHDEEQEALAEALRLARLDEERNPRVLLPAVAEFQPPLIRGEGRLYLTQECFPELNLPLSVRAGLSYVRDGMSGYSYRMVEGIIYLGSSGGSWRRPNFGEVFTPKRTDLSPEGLALLETLDQHYGTRAQLVTVLDT